MSVVTGLKKAAEEIRAEGHNGWGNACEQAAAHIEEQQDTIAELKESIEGHKLDKARYLDMNTELREVLEKLARLGNEPYYGNSDGNVIAKAALARGTTGE